MTIRILIFLGLMFVGHFAAALLTQTADPHARTALTLQAVNGSTAESIQQRSYETSRGWIRAGVAAGYIALAAIIFLPALKTKKKKTK